MRLGILGRYLLREATGALVAVAVVLLAIMISAQFARYLAQAAGGTLPKDLLLSVVALTSLQYLMILIPFSALMAVMLTLGRLYKDQEIAAMNGKTESFSKSQLARAHQKLRELLCVQPAATPAAPAAAPSAAAMLAPLPEC